MRHTGLTLLTLLAIGLSGCGPDSAKNTTPPPQAGARTSQSLLPLPSNTILPTEFNSQGITAGNTDSSSGVSPDGLATFQVPLWVPIGRAGIQPTLSVNYSSEDAYGPLGVGWSLSGTSRITRCTRTVVQDGQAAPITFSPTDAFCVDGQRLTAVQGDHGASGTEYRTEIESFAKIISIGTDEFGPEQFEVYLRDGRVLTYGLENGSSLMERRIRVRPLGATDFETTIESVYNRYAWALAKISDRSGNYVAFHYILNSPTGDHGHEHLLSRIEYTGSSLTPSAPPTRFIHLTYEPRPDVRSQYISGLKLVSTQRVKSISMHGPNPSATGLLRKYNFGYTTSPIRGNSELKTITECDGGNICKRPLTFTYAPEQSALAHFNTGATDLTDLPNLDGNRDNWLLQAADMNGDGRDDLLYRKSANAQDPSTGVALFKWVVRHAQSQEGGISQPQDLALPLTCSTPRLGENGRWLDIDGDGRTDVSLSIKSGCAPQSTTQFHNYKNTPAGLQLVDTGEPGDLWFSDLEGNGAPETLQVISTPTGPQLSYRPNVNGNLQSPLPISTSYINDNLAFSLDIHATGKMSLLIVDKDVPPGQGEGPMWQRYWAVDKTQGQFHKYPTTLVHTGANDKAYLFADINGDRLPDAIRTPLTGGTTLEVLFNTGNGFAAPVTHTLPATAAIPSWARDNGVRIVDFDRDGRDDLLLLGSMPQRTNPIVLLSRDQSFQAISLTIPFGRTTLAGYSLSQTLDLDGDGRIDIAQVVDGALRIYKQQGTLPGLLVQVEDSLGATTRFSYKPVTDSTVYQPGADCSFPRQCLKRGKWVVAEHQVDAGEGHPSRTTRFFYEDGRFDALGRGWLGFSAIVATYLQSETVSRTEFDNQTKVGSLYPYVMKPKRAWTVVLNGEARTFIEQTTTHQAVTRLGNDGHSQIITTAPSVIQVNEFTHPISQPTSSGFARAITTTFQYDLTYGNLLSKREEVTGGDTITATFEYLNIPSAWTIGLPTQIQESSTANGVTTTRTKRNEYSQTTGLLSKEVTDPDNPAQRLSISYLRDADGLISQIVREANGLPSRTTTFTHNSLDRTYPSSITNAVGHTTQQAYHPGMGVLGASVDANNVLTEWQYDGWGRLRRENGPTSTDTAISYTSSPIAGQAFQVRTYRDGGTEAWTGYDRLGRVVTERSRAFENQTYTELVREYDGLGRVLRLKTPNPRGGTNLIATTYEYDRLGRTTRVSLPDGTAVSTSFTATPAGLMVRTVDEKGNASRTLIDVNGRIVQSGDEKTPGTYLTTAFEYGPFGVLRKTRDSAGNETLFEYDQWGRPTRRVDPDAGEERTRFDPFGDVIERRDGNDIVVQIQYDAHGRVVQTDSTRDGRTTFDWDQGTHAKGRLTTSTRHGDMSTTLDDIVTGYTFDSLGRVESELWNIETRLYSMSRTYDAHGRALHVTYPAVQGQTLRIEHGYSAWNGQLTTIKEPGSTGPVHWSVDAVGKTGLLARETFGNGVTTRRLYDSMGRLKFIDTKLPSSGTRIQALAYEYESTGNLRNRYDLIAKTSESFSYDALDRLTRWSVTQNCATSSLNYGYDDLGNLLARTVTQGTGVGGTYGYGDGTAGPHAISSSPEGTYTYDPGGNQIVAPGRSVQFTGFRLPSLITDGIKTTTFRYDASQRRTVKRSSDGSVTTYVGGVYEERRAPDGSATHVFLVPGGGRAVAQAVWKETPGITALAKQWLYLHQDNLGSPESLSDTSGTVVLRSKHEPFGQRRLYADLTTPDLNAAGDVRVGFTGHEQDDELRLINMRGRMYDPQVGRFLSPDPFVQAPLAGQSFNRYSYAFNNPLRFTDPSGFIASERVTYYDSWYGGYVSRDFAAGTPASSFTPDIGWQNIEGYFEAMHGRPIFSYDVATPAQRGTGGSGDAGQGDEVSSTIRRTIVYGERLDIPGYMALLYYHHTQVYGGLLFGTISGVVPFSGLIPLPDGMSDDARFGYSLGLLVGSGLELAMGAGQVTRGLGESGGAAAAITFTEAGILVLPLAIDGAAAVSTGLVLIGDATAKSSRALDILMDDTVMFMGRKSGGSGGGSVKSVRHANGEPWQKRRIDDAACVDGCEDLAIQIQRAVGGEIKTITQPHGSKFLGPMRNLDETNFTNPATSGSSWTFHRVVVKAGRVYDGFTGPAGELFQVYKTRWQLREYINFGF